MLQTPRGESKFYSRAVSFYAGGGELREFAEKKKVMADAG
jgi:hypothetical protein